MTRRGLRATHVTIDEASEWTPERVAALRALVPAPTQVGLYRLQLMRRRAYLIDDVAARYGVTLYPHPRRADVVVVSASDHAWLVEAVAYDPRLDAVGRGYYSGLGGELTVLVAPDWTCDPLSVALARFLVLGLYRPLQPALRALTALTRRFTPKPGPTGKGRSDR